MTVLPLAALAILLVALKFYPLGRRQVQDLQVKLGELHRHTDASS